MTGQDLELITSILRRNKDNTWSELVEDFAETISEKIDSQKTSQPLADLRNFKLACGEYVAGNITSAGVYDAA